MKEEIIQNKQLPFANTNNQGCELGHSGLQTHLGKSEFSVCSLLPVDYPSVIWAMNE